MSTSEQFVLASALDGAHIGVSVAAAAQRPWAAVFANESFAKITGRTIEDRIGEDLRWLAGPGTQSDTLDRLCEAYARGQPFNCELLCYRKDGREFWDRIAVSPIKDQAGVLTHVLVTHEDVTEHKRVRESLRASEARLELAMGASELAMWDWNVARDEVYYNDQWRTVLGIAPEELLKRGKLVERLALPDDQAVLGEFERHYRGEAPHFECEYSLPGGNNETRWLLVRARVVRRDETGKPLRVIGVLRDVTRARRSQQELEEVQRRWERAVYGSSDGLYDWDLVSGHVWYATRFREILGLDTAEFPDTFAAFQRVLHDADRVSVLNSIRAHVEGREPLDVRCRLIRRDGQIVWARFRGQAERDAAGRPRRIAGSISDISAQVEAEEALHRSQDFYGTILDSIPFFIAYADREERVVYANRAFHKFFDIPLLESRGRSVATIVGDRRYEAFQPLIRAALAGEEVEGRGRVRAASGKSIDLDATFVPHRTEDGEIFGCFVVAHDVTHHRQLEAELRQSQKMEAIGRLTGGVAHDFNNLLSVVIGNAQLLARALTDSPRLLKQAETALKAAIRGADLTRRLLAFARQQVLEPKVVDTNGLVGGMWDLLRRTLSGDIDLRQDLSPDAWPVKVDAGQLENAILNLVINARDAMPNGGSITLRTRNVVLADEPGDEAQEAIEAGDYLVVEVIDTGTGMGSDVLKRVFEPFFTTKDVGKGSGLGLSTIYGFMRQSGGHVRLNSTLARGTNARLYFPRTRALLESVEPESVAQTELPRGRETILVVEDNPEVRETAVEILESLGYTPIEAASGPQALEQFGARPEIDLVFSDVMLPGGIIGTTLVEKLRERRPSLKVLLTSGFTDTAIMHRGMLDGSFDVLAKPYRVEELARRVRAILDRNEEMKRVEA